MKTMAPCECKNLDDVCRLQTDNHDLKNYWIMFDGFEVTLTQQAMGEPSKAKISMPKRQFDALVAWYQRQQKLTH